jgi:hypothetical protein
VPVVHGLGDVSTQPLTEFHYSLLISRRAKMPLLALKGHKVLMTAFSAGHPGKAAVQVSEVQVA